MAETALTELTARTALEVERESMGSTVGPESQAGKEILGPLGQQEQSALQVLRASVAWLEPPEQMARKGLVEGRVSQEGKEALASRGLREMPERMVPRVRTVRTAAAALRAPQETTARVVLKERRATAAWLEVMAATAKMADAVREGSKGQRASRAKMARRAAPVSQESMARRESTAAAAKRGRTGIPVELAQTEGTEGAARLARRVPAEDEAQRATLGIAVLRALLGRTERTDCAAPREPRE